MGRTEFDLRVQKTQKLQGRVKAPPSKSYTLRAIVIGSINGSVRIDNPLISDDTSHAIKLWQKLGAKIYRYRHSLKIKGFAGEPFLNGGKLDVGESATLLRFVLPILALSKGRFEVIGKRTLCDRPNTPIVEALKTWEVKISGRGKDHKLPINIISNGKIKGGRITVNGKMSSQTVSSLLIAAPFANRATTIKIKDKLVSKHYVDLTIDVLKWARVNIIRSGYKSFKVKKKQCLIPQNAFFVHGDYSSAAFLMAAACLVKSDVTITDLVNDKQGDKEIINILRRMGARILRKNNSVRIRGPFNLKGIEIDCCDTPDLVPILTVLGCFAEGKTKIYNIKHLIYKESNRITAPAGELMKLNAKISWNNKELLIRHSELRPGRVSSCGDHRVAMALAVAGLVIGNITIEDAHSINKSYPNFISNLKSLGAKLARVR